MSGEFIILTQAQSQQLVGPSLDDGRYIFRAVLLVDGVTYVLPADILTNPDLNNLEEFASLKAQLAACPTRVVEDSEFVQPIGGPGY